MTPPEAMSVAAAAAIAELKATVAAHREDTILIRSEFIRHITDCIEDRKNDQRLRHDAADRVFKIVAELRQDMDDKMATFSARADANAAGLHARISTLKSTTSGSWDKLKDAAIVMLLGAVVFLALRQLGWDSPPPAPQTIPFGSLPAAPAPIP